LGTSRAYGGRCAVAGASLGVAFLGLASGAQAQTGGGVFVAKPQLTKVTCLRGCASRKRAQGGSTLKLTGNSLDGVTRVVFHGSRGRSDDVQAKVRSGGAHRLNTKVPVGAVTGPVSVLSSAGTSSKRTRTIAILPAPPPAPNATLTPAPGAPQLETGTSRTRVFVGARRAVSFSYRVATPSMAGVQLVRDSDGAVVKSWPAAATQPGQVATVVWTGALGKAAAAPGRYSFRLTAQGPNGAMARSAQAGDSSRDAFDLYEHVFPIRGKHQYGMGAGRFGAGRSGHSHQGQDTFARCGTRLVAARGGRVQYSGYQHNAGYYVVIDGSVTGVDYAYMHLAEPSPFRTGDRVYTGQRIGSVGDTGDAQGCHLHFEMWSAPGWYSGGHPFDPLSSLKAWDGWS
jgi:murein DD-endopeptidase MepM/ murein hydrolase activator NlpD